MGSAARAADASRAAAIAPAISRMTVFALTARRRPSVVCFVMFPIIMRRLSGKG
ncbi:MAG: hypothetical protein Kow0059_12740 [Candidatus Sumerlaeia bacterium]